MKTIISNMDCWRVAAAVLLAACVGIAHTAIADPAADAVMFRKPKAKAPPEHSFLLDVAPVKESRGETSKPAAKEPKPEKAAPAPVKASVKVAVPAKAEPVKAVPAKAESDKVVEQEASATPPAKPEKPKTAPVDKATSVVVEPPKQPEAPAKVDASAPVVPVEKKAAPTKEDGAKKNEGKMSGEKDAKKQKAPDREAIITSDRTDYDRKEGIVLFDRNVHVDDIQYQMHADRLFLFLDGTNELKRLVAIGHVAITNEDKRAYCARATFNKKLGRIVMYSSDDITAELREEGKKGSDIKGEKITFWLDSEQVEVENPVITMPGGIGGRGNMKKLIGK